MKQVSFFLLHTLLVKSSFGFLITGSNLEYRKAVK